MEHTAQAYTDLALSRAPGVSAITLRAPTIEDGAAINSLISACPPLDKNSLYCNLLQCSHFADTSVIAESGGRVVGWTSGYIVPDRPDHLFIWQVAVHPSARKRSLGRAMISEILSRPACEGVTHLTTSITEKNVASWRTFSRLSGALRTALESRPWLRRETHLAGRHPTEHEVVIGPFGSAPSR